jgi:hypothetical protein
MVKRDSARLEGPCRGDADDIDTIIGDSTPRG